MSTFGPLPEPFSDIVVARARVEDVPAIVHLLADDPIGAQREGEGTEKAYINAFRDIDMDPNQLLAVLKDADGRVVGTMQLMFTSGLARQGARRLTMESIRIDSALRNRGLGEVFFNWAFQVGRWRGATLAQLTTDKSRTQAHRFYEKLGFVATHEGMKLPL